MAKQIGPIKFRGALDDVCGRQTEDGAILQRKPGPTRKQVLHNDNFINTRRNAGEFGGAIAASTLLRRVLGYTVKAVKHAKLVRYMNQKLHAVALSDTKSGWGERCVNKGDVHLLEGFDYNHALELATALPVTLEYSLDVTTGRTVLAVPGGLVRHKRVFPKQATHFRIVSCAGAVDFARERYASHNAESALLPLGKVMEALELEHQVAVHPGEVMLHTAGMVFYEVVDGEAHLLRGGAMKVVEVARMPVAESYETELQDCKSRRATAQSTGTTAHEVMPHICASGVERFEDIHMPLQEVERHACLSECVAEGMFGVRKVVVKGMVCAPCLLSETMTGIALTVVEGVVGEADTIDEMVVDDMTEVHDETEPDAPAETDDFMLGITDAMGVPLQDARLFDQVRKRTQNCELTQDYMYSNAGVCYEVKKG